ncbi:MAG TPA: hypothetical protein VIH86_05460 [Puia sp.]|jgi:hypothetical protein
MTTYQTKLCLATQKDYEAGLQVVKKDPVFISGESENPDAVFDALHDNEPLHDDWFAVLVIREDGKIVEEEMFDASVMIYR